MNLSKLIFYINSPECLDMARQYYKEMRGIYLTKAVICL